MKPFVAARRLNPREFAILRDLVNSRAGILLSDELVATVERRLNERLVALKLSSFHDYCHYLRFDPQKEAEIGRLIEALTTNETYFFRELPQLRAFQKQVLPRVVEEASTRKTLTVWSAGCSTGEEVYTLAILIAESKLFHSWDVRVFGNDISQRVIQCARQGVYRESSFRALPPHYERYFERTPEGRMIDPRIQEMCAFGHFNLLDEERLTMVGHVDVIFCRNVLIYFDKESRARLVNSFFDHLYPGGYLMLGHSESLLHATTQFELAHLDGDLAYRRPRWGQEPAKAGGNA